MSTKKLSKTRKNDPFFEREAARYAMPLPSREYIQQILEEQGRPVFFERLCDLLDIRKSELDPFERRLLAMEREAQIMRNRKGDETAIFSKGYDKFIPSAIYTARVLEQAPVIVFVVNTKGMDYRQSYPSDKYMMELADIQSISAAIQNMCLEATARNIGSLWTCNIFFAYDELKEWLHADGEMVAAIALGYTDKEIKAMPRKPLAEVVEYRGEYPQPKDEFQEAAEAE